MNVLDPNIRVPRRVRERLGIPIPVDVRFGMDDLPDPLDQPGGYRYEIGESDRAVLEKAVADSNSEDSVLAGLALDALRASVSMLPGGQLAVGVGGFVWNILGKLFSGTGKLSEGAVVYTGERNPAIFGANSGRVVVRKATYDPATGEARLEATATAVTLGVKQNADGSFNAGWISGEAGLAVGSEGSFYPGVVAEGGANTINASGAGYDSEAAVRQTFEANGFMVNEITLTANIGTNRSPSLCGRNIYDPADGTVRTYSGWSCRALPGGDGTLPTYEIDSLEDPGTVDDPLLSDLPPEQARRIPEELRKTPWFAQHPPEPGPQPAPEQPAPGPPHPSRPDWPCGGGGFPDAPGDGPGGGFPNPGSPNAPGFPHPGGPTNVQVPGGPGPGQIDGPPFDCSDARYYPNAPIEVQVGGKTRKGRIAASNCETGEIVTDFPPFGDEYFSKPWCRRNILVVEAIKQLAAQLGMADADWIVDADCKERWTGCFPKGMSKFDAMWKLADMCGYGVFPPGPEIGPMKPLQIFHGPYHEARDFWGYEAQKDSLDIPSHVEVYRPGIFSIVYKVETPYDDPNREKWYSEQVGPGVTRGMANRIALKKKDYFQIRAVAHAVVIPYNDRVQQRHQIRLQRPSLGFTERSMIVSYAHEVDLESDGAVTKLVVSELARTTYPRRNETFAQAWGSLEAGTDAPGYEDRTRYSVDV